MDSQALAQWRVPGTNLALSRRKIFRNAVGVAAAGAAGSMLTGAISAPASAAEQATTVEPGAVAPAVVALADAATITVDASAGNDFRLTIAGDRTMGNPANPADGQKITFQVTQGTGGSLTLAWGTGYEFSAGLPQPTLSTTAGNTDLLGFIYNAAKGKCAGRRDHRVQHHGRHATQGHLPAVPDDERAVQPGVLLRALHRWCRFRGHHGGLLAGRLLVVGVPVRSADGDTEVRAVVRDGTAERGTDRQQHRHLGRPDGRTWNYVALPAPVPLAIGATYIVATGVNGSFRTRTTSSGAATRTATASSTARSPPSPMGPDHGRHCSAPIRACSASRAPTRPRPCRSTGQVAPTSGWTSRSTPLLPRPVLPAVAELPDHPGPS